MVPDRIYIQADVDQADIESGVYEEEMKLHARKIPGDF